LLSELDAIQALDRKDHVILVDDVRILNTDNGGNAWGETVFTENPLAQVIKKIRDINKNYSFCFLDGHVKRDVLCAVVKND
jgi:prepilin-type processing-associated H-X9-DG protein